MWGTKRGISVREWGGNASLSEHDFKDLLDGQDGGASCNRFILKIVFKMMYRMVLHPVHRLIFKIVFKMIYRIVLHPVHRFILKIVFKMRGRACGVDTQGRFS